MPLEPARLAFREDGVPYSESYRDVYHSNAGGLQQATQVFLGGNALPERWQRCATFTIVETGFGQGLNFLATWAAWRADPKRCARLHFVSAELHPFRCEDLAVLHAQWPQLEPLSGALRARWPVLTPGFHRIHLDDGAVVLTLLFGDATSQLRQLDCRADAFFLDGFSPRCNAEMWTVSLYHELARLAQPGATLATWSVTGAVRRGLTEVGFECHKAPGFALKREMLHGRFHGQNRTTRPPPKQHALVVGAGLAGTAIANRLAERGWTIDLIDSAEAPGRGASGNLAGVLRPLPSLDDNRLARLTRAGSLYGVDHLRRLEQSDLSVRWGSCGALHLARDPRQLEKQREVVRTHRYPESYVRFVERDQASEIAGWPVELGGWWFPQGAWVQPPSLCEAGIAAWPQRIRRHLGRTMHRLERRDGHWFALDTGGSIIAHAPIAILANGIAITTVEQSRSLPVRSARGQVSHLPAIANSAPHVVVCRLGYVSPAIDGWRSAGATFSVDDDDPALRETDHQENLARLEFILPGYTRDLTASGLAGRVGFRPASPDRLPIVGAVPSGHPVERDTPLREIPRHPGLYAVSGFGARGLVWASIVAEMLASQLDGDVVPLERELVDAIDPARYLLHRSGRTPARTRSTTRDT